MKIEINSDLLLKAVQTYGVDAQRRMVIEEAGELIVALMHEDRGRIQAENVVEELADVVFMCMQLALNYGEWKFQELLSYKVQRLNDRLSDEI